MEKIASIDAHGNITQEARQGVVEGHLSRDLKRGERESHAVI